MEAFVRLRNGAVLSERLTRLGSKDKVSEYENEWLNQIDNFYNEYEWTKTFLSKSELDKLGKFDDLLESLMTSVANCIEEYTKDGGVQNWQKKIQKSKREYSTYSSSLRTELTGLRDT